MKERFSLGTRNATMYPAEALNDRLKNRSKETENTAEGPITESWFLCCLKENYFLYCVGSGPFSNVGRSQIQPCRV